MIGSINKIDDNLGLLISSSFEQGDIGEKQGLLDSVRNNGQLDKIGLHCSERIL